MNSIDFGNWIVFPEDSGLENSSVELTAFYRMWKKTAGEIRKGRVCDAIYAFFFLLHFSFYFLILLFYGVSENRMTDMVLGNLKPHVIVRRWEKSGSRGYHIDSLVARFSLDKTKLFKNVFV